jgi:hypothetical protein
MEENKVDVILNKKLDGYYTGELNNFTTRDELVVTITLNEYRELVKAKAISDNEIQKARVEACNLREENRKLQNKVKELLDKLYSAENPAEVANE